MRKQKWLRRVLIFVVLVFVASAGFSRALRTRAMRRYLIARLAATFGRPIEVAQFDFSLLDGARIEARSISVAEDPHFGNEYFLRAETLTAGLRWRALVFGHFEFGSLSLRRPSLNLVRDADGHWNIERWLPPAQAAASRPGFVGPLAVSSAARLYRIDVDGGRINFKQGDDKSPFALLDVSGQVEQVSVGRWQLDIEARPMRAGVELQDIGTLRLRGSIAGTSARLQPADLNLTWRAASLADALRLARQQDYGMRGSLDVDIAARVAPPESVAPESGPNGALGSGGGQWSISGVARLAGIHGWRLAGHSTDPSANLSLDAVWRLGEPRALIRKLILEMAQSHLQGTGDLEWAHGFYPQLRIEPSSLSIADILSWYRALLPGVAEDLQAEGLLGVDMTLGGWPLQLQQGSIVSAGGTLSSASLPGPLRIGSITASVSHGGLDFAPAEISFSPAAGEGANGAVSANESPANSFVLRGSVFPDSTNVLRWPLNWNFAIQGGTPGAQDWLNLTAALAQPLNTGWTAAGGVAVRMRADRRAQSSTTVWLGTMDFRDLAVSPAYVNQPVRLLNTHMEFSPQQRTITLTAAEALGATWRGSIARKNTDSRWTFDLTADRLDTSELDRWLGPRARPGFLERFAGFGTPAADAPQAGTLVDRMAARGRLRAGAIAMGSLDLDAFDGDVEISGRMIAVRKAQADFFGGNISGALDVRLVADPSYDFQGHFERVNLAQLAGALPFLNNRIAGIASATLSLSAHGIGRQTLMDTLEGNGTLNARNAEIAGLDLTGIFPGESQDASLNTFGSVHGAFRVHDREIDLANFVLDDARGRLEAEGPINFSHALSLRLHPSILQATTSPNSASPPSFLLSGTIEDPKLVLPSPAAQHSARSGARAK
jgi:hypothetical protein